MDINIFIRPELLGYSLEVDNKKIIKCINTIKETGNVTALDNEEMKVVLNALHILSDLASTYQELYGRIG